MLKKGTLIILIVISIIFVVGFALRAESTHLSGIPDNEKSYYKDQNNLPYMYELDSYYNYRLTKNYLDHGYLGDAIINGTEWDLHSYYPPGVPMDYPPLIVFLTAFFYKLVNLFTNVPLIVVCFWIPALIAPLSGVIAFLFVRRFTNDYGGFVAGILTVTIPFYFMRTVPGWFDTDMFNVLFPLLVTWLFFEAVHNRNRYPYGIIISALAAFSMFIFSMAWGLWVYNFYLIILFSSFYIIWCKFKGKKVKNLFYVLGTFFIGTILMLWIFSGYMNVIKLFTSPFELINVLGHQTQWYPWPNVYLSVSELGKPSIKEVISGLGFTLFSGLFGFFWIFRIMINKKLKNQFLSKMNWFFFSFIIIWTIVCFFTLLQGARFIIMLIPPLIISSGIIIGVCIDYLNLLKNSHFTIFKRRKNIIKIIAIFIVFIVTIPSILNVAQVTVNPNVNDDLWDASEWIQNNTSYDTVIISSWSYGHLFTGIANRSVLFDGRLGYLETMPIRDFDNSYVFGSRSPSVSRDYWINEAFSTSNESLSFGIFRMLSTSGDLAWLTLDEYSGNTTKSIEILNNILGVDKKTAQHILINYNLNQKQAENILKYTHPNNPNPFVIVTYDTMINSGKWIFKFGNWNFNETKGIDPIYSVGDINMHESFLNTSNGIFMNLKNDNVKWENKTPYSLIITKDGDVKSYYFNKKSNFCVILLMDDKKAIVIDKHFENSLFMKLVVEKNNSTYFKSVYKNKKVVVWIHPHNMIY